MKGGLAHASNVAAILLVDDGGVDLVHPPLDAGKEALDEEYHRIRVRVD